MENAKWVPVNAGVLSARSLNPWVEIWTRPRQTVRQLLIDGADWRMLLIVSLTGIGSILDRASGRNLGDSIGTSAILLLAVLLGPAAGICTLFIGSWLTSVTGRWLGGRADSASLRIPIAWSGVPSAVGALLWIPALALLGSDMFTAEVPRVEANPVLAIPLLVLGLGWIVLAIWAVVLMCHTVAEAQGYASAWRGLGNVLLAGILVLAIIFGLAVAAAIMVPAML